MKFYIEVFLFCLAGMMLAVVLIEWAVGCGEGYTDSQGDWHQYECVLVPTRTMVPP